MTTRSVTKIYNYEGTVLAAMYRQYDGYYDRHGQELADFLASKTLVKGISRKVNDGSAHGPGCLAAQIITYFKKLPTTAGKIYLSPPTPEQSEEYTYEVRCVLGRAGCLPEESESIRLVAQGHYGLAFDGDPAEFDGGYLEEVDCADYNPNVELIRKQALAKLVGVLTDEERSALRLV